MITNDVYLALVVRSAARWWRSKRPRGWTLAQHLESPWVNLSAPADIALAEAIARYLAPVKPAKRREGNA